MKQSPRVSPQAMTIFLKQAALEEQWTTQYLSKALGLNLATSKQLASELALAGYIEPVPRKRDVWRNTAAGNALARVRSARLTRAKAEDLLGDLEDRAGQFNLNPKSDLRIQRIVALGSVVTEHDRIQDIDVAVQFADSHQGQTELERELDALKFLKAGSPSLKMHVWEDSLALLQNRLIWKA